MMEYMDDVVVAGNYPGAQVRIPMHRILISQPVIERIRVGQDLRIEQLAQAQLGSRAGQPAAPTEPRDRFASMADAKPATVGVRKRWRSVSSTPKASRMRAII